jgi:hypothetical protein
MQISQAKILGSHSSNNKDCVDSLVPIYQLSHHTQIKQSYIKYYYPHKIIIIANYFVYLP